MLNSCKLIPMHCGFFTMLELKHQHVVYFSLRASLDNKRHDAAFFLKGIQQFGKLFDFDATEPYDYAGFGQILEEIDKNFNISDKLRKVRSC